MTAIRGVAPVRFSFGPAGVRLAHGTSPALHPAGHRPPGNEKVLTRRGASFHID